MYKKDVTRLISGFKMIWGGICAVFGALYGMLNTAYHVYIKGETYVDDDELLSEEVGDDEEAPVELAAPTGDELVDADIISATIVPEPEVEILDVVEYSEEHDNLAPALAELTANAPVSPALERVRARLKEGKQE